MEPQNNSYPLSQDIESEKLQMFVSCRNLVDLDLVTVTDSFLIVKLQQADFPEKQILRTKIYQNDLNPNYAESILIDFIFQIKQRLKFQVYHQARPPILVGKIETSVGQIFGSSNHGLIKDLIKNSQKRGKIVIRCQKVQNIPKIYNQLKIKAQNLPNIKTWYLFGGTSAFFRIIRRRKDDQILIYESQVVNYSTNPQWKKFILSQRKLSDNNQNQEIELVILNYSKTGHHTIIGRTKFTTSMLLQNIVCDIISNKFKVGTLIFQKVYKKRKYQFSDYLQHGLQLQLTTCIDFTASNGDPEQLHSLHFTSKIVKCPYKVALQSILNILLDYDDDKLIAAYGFGAKVRMQNFDSKGQVSHCFPLNGNQQNPYNYQIQGLMFRYNQIFQYLKLSGPTFFSEILKKSIEKCKKDTVNQNYQILLILTDGEIDDIAKVKDLIVQCNNLPISIIIIGIGKGKFEKMKQLDDDSNEIVDSKGNRTTRDLVQFVEFEKLKSNNKALAKQVLEQLPNQVSQYYMNKTNQGIRPQDLRPRKGLSDIQRQVRRQRYQKQLQREKRLSQG